MTTTEAKDDIALDSWEALKMEPQVSADELDRWRTLRGRVIDKARQNGWSKAEFSRRSGVPAGTLYGWLDGSYAGAIKAQSDRIEKFLSSVEELSAAGARIPQVPGYTVTPTSQQVIDALVYAQTMPEIAIVVLAAGMGKTFTLEHYAAARPHVFKVTMRPSTTTVHKLMGELADLLNLSDFDRVPTRLDRAVGMKLKRNGRSTLLLVDEAQHLKDDSVNQLRYFFDMYNVGIALVGNEELYSRFGDAKPAYAQLQSRFGLKVRRMVPQSGDIEAILNAWNITDPDIRALGNVIGRKPGTLRQLTKTLQLAGMFALGAGHEMTAADVKLAAQNRGLEG